MYKYLQVIIFLIFIYSKVFSQYPKYIYGISSWYGEEFAGRKTASGEIFDPEKYTAAHRSLPFGTIIEVENLDNGKKVVLTINDRGPFVENRILDVTKRAAKELGFLSQGTAYVRITILKLGNNEEYIKNISKNIQEEKKEVIPQIISQQPAQSSNIATSNIIEKTEKEVIEPKNIQLEKEKKQDTVKTPTSITTNIVIFTNLIEQYITNYITNALTNTTTINLTNIITIPPYEDKITEREININEPPIIPIEDENDFIIDEPMMINTNYQASLPKKSSTSQTNIDTNESFDFNEYELDDFEDIFTNFDSKNIIESISNNKEIEKYNIEKELSNELYFINTLTNSIESKESNGKDKKIEKAVSNNYPLELLPKTGAYDSIVLLSNNILKIVGARARSNLSSSNNNTNKLIVPEQIFEIPDEILIEPEKVPIISNEKQIPIQKEEKISEKEKTQEKYTGFSGISYVVQIGAFYKEENAYNVYEKLRKEGFCVFMTETVVNNKRLIRVRVGYFNSIDEATKILQKLKKYNINGLIVKISNYIEKK